MKIQNGCKKHTIKVAICMIVFFLSSTFNAFAVDGNISTINDSIKKPSTEEVVKDYTNVPLNNTTTKNRTKIDEFLTTSASNTGELVGQQVSVNQPTAPVPSVRTDSKLLKQLHFGEYGVNPGTGNFSTSSIDLSTLTSFCAVDIGRIYNSMDNKEGGMLGIGWGLNYQCFIADTVENENGVNVNKKVVSFPDGSTAQFRVNADGTFTGETTRFKMVKNSDKTYDVVTIDQNRYKYIESGWLVEIKDRNANVITIDLDSKSGKIARIIDQVDRQYKFTYNDKGFISAILDPIGRSVSYSYNTNNLLSKVTMPDGSWVSYEYDTNKMLNKIRNANDIVTQEITYCHDGGTDNNKVRAIKNELGNQFTFMYDPNTKMTTITDSKNRVVKKSYDERFFTTISEDPEARKTTVSYLQTNKNSKLVNLLGEIEKETDRNGNTTVYKRDDNGNVQYIEHPNTSRYEYTYDEKNNITSEKDEVGHMTYYVYDNNKVNLVKKIQPLKAEYSYNPSDKLIDRSKFSVTQYEYFSPEECRNLGYKMNGLLKAIIDADGRTTVFTYDLYGNEKTVEEGLSTTFASDNNGNETVVINGTGKTTTNFHNRIGWLVTSISPKKNKTDLFYDLQGRIVKRVQNDGQTSRIVFDNLGRKIKEISPNQYNPTLDNQTTFSYSGDHGIRYIYNTNNTVQAVIDAENNRTSYTYDIYGNVETETKPNNAVYKYVYDCMDRKTKTLFKASATEPDTSYKTLEEYGYAIVDGPSVNNVVQKYTKMDHSVFADSTIKYQISETYDDCGKLVLQVKNSIPYLQISYYKNGTVESRTDAENNTIYSFYDSMNRLIETRTPCENANGAIIYSLKKTAYDNTGNIVSQEENTNKPGEQNKFQKISYEYDLRGLLNKVITYKEDGSAENYTQYYYDDEKNQVRMYTGLCAPLNITGLDAIQANVDTVYSTTQYEYDCQGKPISITDPLGKTEYLDYDVNGNLVGKVDKNGTKIKMTYDNLNRLLSKSTITRNGVSSTNSYTYYFNIGRKTATGSGIDEVCEYDAMGRLASINQSNGAVMNYEYNLDGSEKKYELKLNGIVKIKTEKTYDEQNRLKNVLENGQLKATYDYYKDGTRKSVAYCNGNTTLYDYTLNDCLKSLKNMKGNQVVSTYLYDYYLNGNIYTKTAMIGDKLNLTKYTYDGLGRLQRTDEDGTTTVYNYDDSNNRKQMTISSDAAITIKDYMYNQNNQMVKEIAVTGTNSYEMSYQYDENGNLVRKTTDYSDELTDTSEELRIYDFEKDTDTDEIPIDVEFYTYDGLDQLVSVKTLGHTYSYQYDSDGLRISKNIDGQVTNQIWNQQQIVLETDGQNKVKSKYIRGTNLLLAANDQDANEEFYLYNGHGDVVQLADTTGSAIQFYDYNEFGTEKNVDSTDDNVFRYCGEYFDKETGSIYLRARYYDPEIGRFITEDSYEGKIKDPLSLNLYTYCKNNPINLWDPSGHIGEPLGMMQDPNGGGGDGGGIMIIILNKEFLVETAKAATKAAVKSAMNATLVRKIKSFFEGGLKTLDDLLPSGVTKEMLIDTASTSGKGGVTPIGRAFQKHNSGNRAGTFVGEVTGNPGKNTQQGLDYLNDILGNPNSTLVAKEHKQFGNIIDIRLPDGTGVRFTADGQTFIGFLEKYTPKK